jgi:glycerol-3-phosphate dehydrogenase (NAD(P)+)
VGATSWGVTLAWLLARNGHAVRLLCRTIDEARQINETHRAARSPGFELPPRIVATSDVPIALHGIDALTIAVPSQSVRENAVRIAGALAPRTLTVHATKGLEQGTAQRVSEMVFQELPQLAPGDICALSGPNLAPEIQRGLPAATVIAGSDAANVARAQALFHSGGFRVYASSDLAGVELAGSLKNVVALAAGIADGFALGDNAKAGIITRGLAEITRLGVAAGADPATFAGLAGAGDVMATCYSPLSRNRRTGEAIARGASVADAIASAGGVVEGIEATAAACTLAERYGVEMPIAHGLRAVLFEGAAPSEVMRRLMEREATREL